MLRLDLSSDMSSRSSVNPPRVMWPASSWLGGLALEALVNKLPAVAVTAIQKDYCLRVRSFGPNCVCGIADHFGCRRSELNIRKASFCPFVKSNLFKENSSKDSSQPDIKGVEGLEKKDGPIP